MTDDQPEPGYASGLDAEEVRHNDVSNLECC